MAERADETDRSVEAGDQVAEQDGRGTADAEGGRRTPVEGSPEERLMQIDNVTAGEAAPDDRSRRERTFDEIDDRAAGDARMDVRRREHSAE